MTVVAKITLPLLLAVLPACAGEESVAAPGAGAAAGLEGAAQTGQHDSGGAPIEPPEEVGRLLQPRSSDWQEMLERRVIRVLVTYNRTHFFLDLGRQRGLIADALVELEKHLNSKYQVGARKLHVAAVPVTRDQLIPYLEQGRGDIAAANLTITPERLERVDFSVPTSKPVDELVVTGPQSPPLSSLDDLAGQEVHVRPESSFWGSLERLSEKLVQKGLPAIEIVPADSYLETEDLLEMVNAGLIPITVADSHLATFWRDIYTDLVVHEDLAVATGEHIGWAIRKDADGLKEILDPWIEANRQGRLLGNMLIKRYLQSKKYVTGATQEAERARFLEMVDLFRTYGSKYGLDPLLVAAQGYQESGLDQSKRSPVGAIGVMQVMPATANDPAVGISNIDQLEPNIHAGSKYLAHLIEVYFDDPEVDDSNRMLFAFAGYNAGPNRINRLRKVAAEEGLDPNVWFRNVEMIVAREVGREPVHYVANIYKYYVAYRLVLEQEALRQRAA